MSKHKVTFRGQKFVVNPAAAPPTGEGTGPNTSSLGHESSEAGVGAVNLSPAPVAGTGGWPCQSCGYGHETETPCPPKQTAAAGTTVEEVIHRLNLIGQQLASVEHGQSDSMADALEAAQCYLESAIKLVEALRNFIPSQPPANKWPDLVYGDTESWCGKYTRNGEANIGGNINSWYATAVFWRNKAEFDYEHEAAIVAANLRLAFDEKPVSGNGPEPQEIDIPFCDSPCGHSSQYAWPEDGGKNIVCLVCELAEVQADLGTFAAAVWHWMHSDSEENWEQLKACAEKADKTLSPVSAQPTPKGKGK